jgi:hypothetical protein
MERENNNPKINSMLFGAKSNILTYYTLEGAT